MLIPDEPGRVISRAIRRSLDSALWYYNRVWDWDSLGDASCTHFTLRVNESGIINQVSVEYSPYPDGRGRKCTPWKEDQKSIERYGMRSKVFSLGTMSNEGARDMRDRFLRERAWPSASFVGVPLEDLSAIEGAQVEACKREIARRARWMGLDYQSRDIKSFSYDGWGTAIFLTRCNPVREIEWIKGIPVPVLDRNGNPVITYTYPLYIEYGQADVNKGKVPYTFEVTMNMKWRVPMPQLVFIVLPDGTIKDGWSGHGAIQERLDQDYRSRVHGTLERISHDLGTNLHRSTF